MNVLIVFDFLDLQIIQDTAFSIFNMFRRSATNFFRCFEDDTVGMPHMAFEVLLI